MQQKVNQTPLPISRSMPRGMRAGGPARTQTVNGNMQAQPQPDKKHTTFDEIKFEPMKESKPRKIQPITTDNYQNIIKEWGLDKPDNIEKYKEEQSDIDAMHKEYERISKLNKTTSRIEGKNAQEMLGVWDNITRTYRDKNSHVDINTVEELKDTDILETKIPVDINIKCDKDCEKTIENSKKIYKTGAVKSKDTVETDYRAKMEQDFRAAKEKEKTNTGAPSGPNVMFNDYTGAKTSTDAGTSTGDGVGTSTGKFSELPPDPDDNFMYSECMSEEDLLIFLCAITKMYNVLPKNIHVILDEKKTAYTVLEIYYVDENNPDQTKNKCKLFSERQPPHIAEVVENVRDSFLSVYFAETKTAPKPMETLYLEYVKK